MLLRSETSALARCSLLAATFAMARASFAAAFLPLYVNSNSDVVDASPGDGVCETELNNGVCTLRAAVMEANQTQDKIVTIYLPALPPGGMYRLEIAPGGGLHGFDDDSTGDLNVTRDVSLVGDGAATTIIDGHRLDSVFRVDAVAAISGVTIRDGLARNAAGGILVYAGSLMLADSVVSGNTSILDAGGVGVRNAAEATITRSTISGNLSGGSGGGISSAGTLALVDSTVSGNWTSYTGGGIANGNELTAVDSTVSGNKSNANGGGIYITGGDVLLANVTISDNEADADLDGSGSGGGIAFDPVSSDPAPKVANSIIAGNYASALVGSNWLPSPNDCKGELTSLGFNMLFDDAGCTIYGGHTTADPKLGRLQGNGGPTETHTLLPGSPAIDAGDPGGCRDRAGALVATDQRGFARPAVGCDLGAYEAPEPGAAALGVSALAAVWLCGTGGKRAARA